MPPQPYWFAGRDAIAAFLRSRVLTEAGRFLMFPTAANGQPAFAVYERGSDGSYLAHAIQVPAMDAASVTGIVSFNDARLVTTFGLPAELSAAASTAAALR